MPWCSPTFFLFIFSVDPLVIVAVVHMLVYVYVSMWDCFNSVTAEITITKYVGCDVHYKNDLKFWSIIWKRTCRQLEWQKIRMHFFQRSLCFALTTSRKEGFFCRRLGGLEYESVLSYISLFADSLWTVRWVQGKVHNSSVPFGTSFCLFDWYSNVLFALTWRKYHPK